MRWGLALGSTCVSISALACAAIADLQDPSDPTDAEEAGDAGVQRADTGDRDASNANDTGGASDSAKDAPIDPCTDPGLLAYWNLDEGTGSAINDCSSNGHDGTAIDAPQWVAGRKGGSALSALSFDGTTQYVDFGKPDKLAVTGALSVTAWVNVRTINTAGRIVTKSGGGTDRGWELNLELDGRLRYRIGVEPTTEVEASLATFSTFNVWKHIAGVYEPNVAVRLYIDGTEVASATSNIPMMQRDSAQPVWIGKRFDGGPLDGIVDEVRVYGRVLSPSEVKAMASNQ